MSTRTAVRGSAWMALGLAGLLATPAACRPAAAPQPTPSPSGAPAAPSATGTEALPPGHPPVGGTGEASLSPGHPPLGGDAGLADAAAGEAISGTVTLGPKLAGRATGLRVLYVIARASGSQHILAVRKEDVARFPLEFRISAADAMVAGTAFKGPFDLTARLSKSGDAMAGPGDLEGTVRGVASGATGVAITLDSVRQ